jgi:hypothetical protein
MFQSIYRHPEQGWDQARLEALLLEGMQDFGNHHSRRFAITALSHLCILTPAILTALLEAVCDEPEVQQDAIAAAGRFYYLSPDFQRDETFALFTAALSGESLAVAYVAAKLLGVLGSLAVSMGDYALSRRIAGLLGEALHHPNAQKIVYLFDNRKKPGFEMNPPRIEDRRRIDEQGPLAKTLWVELGRVAGLDD